MRRATSGVVVAGVMLVLMLALVGRPSAQSVSSPLDDLLDLYVRDGYVYYRALKQDRKKLDAVVAGLPQASLSGQSRTERIAFWLNTYNALVLRTVIDAYPIAPRSSEYPPHSVRQIPGAFDRTVHRVASQAVTLDQIEQSILPAFEDPRVFFALGRGRVREPSAMSGDGRHR
jgi:hypothetical protein